MQHKRQAQTTTTCPVLSCNLEIVVQWQHGNIFTILSKKIIKDSRFTAKLRETIAKPTKMPASLKTLPALPENAAKPDKIQMVQIKTSHYIYHVHNSHSILS